MNEKLSSGPGLADETGFVELVEFRLHEAAESTAVKAREIQTTRPLNGFIIPAALFRGGLGWSSWIPRRDSRLVAERLASSAAEQRALPAEEQPASLPAFRPLRRRLQTDRPSPRVVAERRAA